MNIGILGSGNVGQVLGKGFADRGYDVKIGSRTPEGDKIKSWVKETGKKTSAGSLAQAAAFGNIIVLATPGTATDEAIDLAGPSNFRGKILIDTTNALDFSKGTPGLFVGVTDSLGERVQRKLPETKVVKCFNTVSSSQMVNPTYKDVEMLICGNDAAAKREVEKILKEFGWKGAIDVGGIDGARWLEALVPLWVRVGSTLNTWSHVFKVLYD